MGKTFYFNWEPELMHWLQIHLSGTIGDMVKSCSAFGEVTLLVMLMGLFYWGFDKKLGRSIAFNLCLSSALNGMIKNLIMRRRPYFDHSEIKCLRPVNKSADLYDIKVQGFSMPSNHSGASAAAFGSIAVHKKEKKWYAIAVLLPFLTGLSRMFVGVHYPTDVLLGWGLGVASMGITSLLFRFIKKNWIVYLIFIGMTIPGCFYCKTEDYYTFMGMMLGLSLGSIFEEHFVRFKETRNVKKIALRMLGGAMTFFLVTYLLKLPFSKEMLHGNRAISLVIRVMRYGITIFVIIGIYPMIFHRISWLTDKENK